MKLLFVDEVWSYRTPLRLSALAYLPARELAERCHFTSLYYADRPKRWAHADARKQAERLWMNMTHDRDAVLERYSRWEGCCEGVEIVVLIGPRVARAFGVSSLDNYSTRVTSGPMIATLPTLDGAYWLDAANTTRATTFLTRLFTVAAQTQPSFWEDTVEHHQKASGAA